MPRLIYPVVDVKPGDVFEAYHSTVTGLHLVYQNATRIAEYDTRSEALALRNKLRKQEERARAKSDWEARETAAAIGNMQAMRGT